jgi:phosphotransacetylase
MPLSGFDELQARADARRPGLPVAVAGAADLTVLEALRRACDRGWVAPTLAARAADLRRLAERHGVDLVGMKLVDAEEPATAAVEEVRAGRARLLMKGQVATPALMRAVLASAAGLRTGRAVCQVVLMEVRPTGRRFLLADTGIIPQPTLEQKADILASAVAVARALGEPRPGVAVMAATEAPTEALPDTLEAAELQRRNQAGEWPGCTVQGPLSFDLAYAPGAADKKQVAGPVPGTADVMLFPNLTAANLTVKAIMYTADCAFGGILCGVACPVVFMSRADSAETRLRSLALALGLIAHPEPGPE